MKVTLETVDYRGKNKQNETLGESHKSEPLILEISDESGVLAAISAAQCGQSGPHLSSALGSGAPVSTSRNAALPSIHGLTPPPTRPITDTVSPDFAQIVRIDPS